MNLNYVKRDKEKEIIFLREGSSDSESECCDIDPNVTYIAKKLKKFLHKKMFNGLNKTKKYSQKGFKGLSQDFRKEGEGQTSKEKTTTL